MRVRSVALAVMPLLFGVLWAAPPAAAADVGHRHGGGWTSEQRWSPRNDWEPNTAADPSSSWLYQMTTRYGGASVCRPHMAHCIRFRS